MKMRMSLERAVVAAAMLVLLSAAPASADAGVHRVGVLEDAANDHWGFSPGEITVKVGDTIEFVNDGAEAHDLYSEALFEAPSWLPGQSSRFTFTQPGDVEYLCTLHTNMVGLVHVQP
jgi:plastocyanin